LVEVSFGNDPVYMAQVDLDRGRDEDVQGGVRHESDFRQDGFTSPSRHPGPGF
jgi:hypothetical protein